MRWRKSMQLGSLLRSSRRRGPDVWEFRYRERPHNGRRIYRRMKVGTVREFRNEASVRKGITGLIREINFGDVRVQATTMTVAELVGALSAARVGVRQHLEKLLNQMRVRKSLEKLDRATLGKLQTPGRQNDRSRNVAPKLVARQIEFRKDS